MDLRLRIWRQKNKNTTGKLVTYELPGISPICRS